jgi:hypothetical protein
MHIKFWSGNLKASDHLEDLGVEWEENIKIVTK